MATQTTYSERMQPWVAGFDPDMSHGNRITRTVETAAGIGFGLAVSRGTDVERGAVLGGDLDSFLGASVRDPTLAVRSGVDVDEYQQYMGICIKQDGPLIVQSNGAVGPDDPVYFDGTTGVFQTGSGIGPVLGARFLTTAANGLVKVHLPRYGQAT